MKKYYYLKISVLFALAGFFTCTLHLEPVSAIDDIELSSSESAHID